ncbi:MULTISPECIES: DUF262 domain-containing protein [Salipiger]|uniref:GmrSD restriction endonucleases N-terminal domain-containing protein n=1 Tax=Salipiger profundus TaxID=1229727 RepID=A0A1U7DD76_9RHOB|nr:MULTISPECIES: DUF262 domain-containing protein [Salipiger]APX26089.1 hypothetical protein Ga0080559_TMP5020 [Salipiger profundus]GGA29122.1 hypothetical protein GCM10011326_46390 [Salipiger profundus]
MSVSTLLDGIEKGRIVLPAIQRDFVWNADRIEKLFDSLFRGYPIGVVLLWDTTEAIQYRTFDAKHRRGARADYRVNDGETVQLVLDGQQRLTSLYIALRGSLDGRKLHFDVLSGRSSDDASEEKFSFRFMTSNEAKARNAQARGDNDDEAVPAHYVALTDFSGQSAPGKALRKELDQAFNLGDEDEERLIENLRLPLAIMTDRRGLLQEQVIDEGLTKDDASRKTVFDILEIFMRINTQGINLTRSDLILSMLRLHWPDATDALPKFIEDVNSKSSIKIDSDFVIRCIFSVAGLGTRLDIGLLRKEKNVEKVKAAYDKTTAAIRSAIDFAQDECRLGSVKLLNGLNSLVPVVHYLAEKKKPIVANSERADLRRAIYLIAFSGVLTKHSDSRPGGLIREALGGLPAQFPYDRVARYVKAKTRIEGADNQLFGNHVPLALALVQGKTDGKTLYARNVAETDHIFPRARHGDDPLIDDIGNLWFLPQHVNRSKTDAKPKTYLADVDDATLEAALIDREDLKKRFPTFVKARRRKMIAALQERTGISSL